MTLSRFLLLASLALGIALGTAITLWLVFWRSGAEPETEYKPVPKTWFADWNDPAMDVYDGEAVGV